MKIQVLSIYHARNRWEDITIPILYTFGGYWSSGYTPIQYGIFHCDDDQLQASAWHEGSIYYHHDAFGEHSVIQYLVGGHWLAYANAWLSEAWQNIRSCGIYQLFLNSTGDEHKPGGSPD